MITPPSTKPMPGIATAIDSSRPDHPGLEPIVGESLDRAHHRDPLHAVAGAAQGPAAAQATASVPATDIPR